MDKYIGKTLKGKEFIDLFPEMSDKLAKLTNYEENHNGYIFKTGLNIDTKKFDADKKCGYGIYFTDIYNMILWMSYMRKKVTKFLNIFRWENEYEDKMIFYRKVTLPLDCNICIESRDKFKADKIILGERMRIEDLDFWKDENFCLRCVEKHNTQIIMMYIRNYSDKVNLALVKKDPFILNDLINRKHMEISEEIQLEAVKRNGLVIGYIKNPSEEVQLEALKQNPTSIKYIKSPCKAAQLVAFNHKDCIRHQNKKCIKGVPDSYLGL